MTDELEALLEEADEEEPGAPMSHRKRGLWGKGTPPAATIPTRSPRKARGEPETVQDVGEGAAQEGGASRMVTKKENMGLKKQAHVERAGEIPRKTPTEERAQTALTTRAGQALYVQMAHTRRAAEYRPAAVGPWLPLEKGGRPGRGTAVGDAAALDRIFQRDARRYDGGFTWL